MKKNYKTALLWCLPGLLSLAAWLPLAFLTGGSLMDALEVREKLGPALLGSGGYASWTLLPRYPTPVPYIELLLDSPAFFVMFWNSVRITAGALIGQLLCAVPAAWWFALHRGRLSRWLYTLYLVLMIMPFQVTMVSSYLVLGRLGLLDSHWSIILPAAFSTFPVFIIYRFFRSIPVSLIEAAQLDGAGPFQLFRHIGLPLGRGGIICALVLGVLDCWNMIEQPMTFLKEKARWPLSLFLPAITVEGMGLALAASVITLLPVLLVFLWGQSHLEEGITASGVKE